MSGEVIQAFEIGAHSTALEVHYLIIGVFFSLLFLITAYISLNIFEEVKRGDLNINKFFAFIVRIAILMLITGYFLLP